MNKSDKGDESPLNCSNENNDKISEMGVQESALIIYEDNNNSYKVKTPRNGVVPFIKDLDDYEGIGSNLTPGEDIATATKNYKINQEYESCNGLVSNIYTFALDNGFGVTRMGSFIKCNKAHYRRHGWSSRDTKNPTRCECELKIKF